MRIFTCFCLFLLLSGCTALIPSPLIPPDQQLFVKGMDEVGPKKPLPSEFVTLQETYPESSWSASVEVVKALLATIKAQQETITRLQRGAVSRRQENQELKQKRVLLEEDLKKFKQLLIDLETRKR